jgi:glycosyltransferase involved in cell wall biosynthesis
MLLNFEKCLFPPHSRRRALMGKLRRWLRVCHEFISFAREAGWQKAYMIAWATWRENRLAETTIGQWLDAPSTHTPLAPHRLRILTYHWHTAYQYELFKLPHEFTLVRGVGLPFNNAWEYEIRPMPTNARFVHARDLRLADYDLAIVHFDENVLAPENCCGLVPPGWGRCFSWMMRQPLPKLGICHGTPQFYGQYDISYAAPDLMQVREDERTKLVRAVGDMPVACNSHQSLQEWGFAKARVIWHGLDPDEFLPGPSPGEGILTLRESALRSRPHYNGYFLWRDTIARLEQPQWLRTTTTPCPKRQLQNHEAYARAKFENYKNTVRSAAVYYNPTLRSPMPRSRTEAMFCGLVPVTTSHHDADMFIRHGSNGFVADDARAMAESLTFCMKNPEKTRAIGMKARGTACDIFHVRRFLAEWQEFLQVV